MQLLEIYNPAIDAHIKFQSLEPEDVDEFLDSHRYSDKDEFARSVIERVVYNLRTDIIKALRKLDKVEARVIMESIYNGCIMLNPGLDVDAWMKISASSLATKPPPSKGATKAITSSTKKSTTKKQTTAKKRKRITRAKFRGLEPYLKDRVIGQNDAVESVVSALKRSIVGLSDDERPLGVFLFAGASGIGKTHLAKELHSYLFGDTQIVRIDCGEYQHKHENQKLIGSPPGYVAHEEGGQLTEKIKKNPNTVLLLDEVEKAHPDMWDTFLRVFDEGIITDAQGEEVDFRNTIIIMTTNLGNKESVDSMVGGGIGFGQKIDHDIKSAELPSRSSIIKYTDKAIRKKFRPEFLNRIDKTVVFNHLLHDDMILIAELEMDRIVSKLKKKGISLTYETSVTEKMLEQGVNPIEGARGLSKVRREYIEDTISDALLSESRWPRGTAISLFIDEDQYQVDIRRPKKKRANKTGDADDA